jgi:hypothetical protein
MLYEKFKFKGYPFVIAAVKEVPPLFLNHVVSAPT